MFLVFSNIAVALTTKGVIFFHESLNKLNLSWKPPLLILSLASLQETLIKSDFTYGNITIVNFQLKWTIVTYKVKQIYCIIF